LRKKRQHFFHQRVGRNAMFLAQNWTAACSNDSSGQHPTMALNSLRIQMLHHRAAKSVGKTWSQWYNASRYGQKIPASVSSGLIQRG